MNLLKPNPDSIWLGKNLAWSSSAENSKSENWSLLPSPVSRKQKYTRCSQEATTIFGTENRRGFLPRPPKKDSVMSPTSFRAKSKIFMVQAAPPPSLFSPPPLPALHSSFSSLFPSFTSLSPFSLFSSPSILFFSPSFLFFQTNS